MWDELIEVMRKLRSQEGCPWDKEQTHKSLTPFVVEEAYEVIEAIDEEKYDKLCEELGDLLLQVVFHAQIAGETGKFDINDVILNIIRKLKRRHPHVFGEKKIETSREVLVEWEKIKLEEKGIRERESLMDGIPENLPSLHKAERVQNRAKEVGFQWPDAKGALEKIKEEIIELEESYKKNDIKDIREEIGDLLFSIVNFARYVNINADESLRKTNRKFVKRFKYIEKISGNRDNLKKLTLDEMDKLWNEAKKSE